MKPGLDRRSTLAAGAALALALAAGPGHAAARALTSDERRALDLVRADSLRGRLSFLASDTLGGRETPSLAGDLAAEYVAAELRRAGLEPAGDEGYFQTIRGAWAIPSRDGFVFTLASPSRTIEVSPDAFRTSRVAGLSLRGVPVVRVAPGEDPPAQAEGSAIVTELPSVSFDQAGARGAFRRRAERLSALRASGADAVIVVDRRPPAGPSSFERRVLLAPPAAGGGQDRDVVITASDPGLVAAFDDPAALKDAKLTLRVPPAAREEVILRNVAGRLKGSDPALADTYLLVSAHYDTTGPTPGPPGPDRIWNGANDDGSGTVTLIELAEALATLKPAPRRSILFVAFCAEEKGERGSAYYAGHPLVPLERTVAQVNLEHLGRTDAFEGDRAGTASLTGFSYSDLPEAFREAGELFGVRVYEDPQRSAPFFLASDNRPLAEKGVVAHTVSVLFEDFADYHRPGDEWQKIDYPNLERTARMVGAAVLLLANDDHAPAWKDVPETAAFRAAAAARVR